MPTVGGKWLNRARIAVSLLTKNYPPQSTGIGGLLVWLDNYLSRAGIVALCTGTDGLKWPSVIHGARFSGAWTAHTQGKLLLNSGCGGISCFPCAFSRRPFVKIISAALFYSCSNGFQRNGGFGEFSSRDVSVFLFSF